jgi:hypothetical protein
MTERRINDDIKIDFKVSRLLKNTMEEAEELDRTGSVEYEAVADAIDVICKAHVTNGHMTEEQWNIVTARYPI